jgi:hypothetical protein
MDAFEIGLMTAAWVGLMGIIVALCSAAGRADRNRREPR